MDSRDLLILGGLGVAGFFAWRWWKKVPAANQAQQPKNDVQGSAASQMTNGAARSTVFGGSILARNLFKLPEFPRPKPAATLPPYMTQSARADWEMSTNPTQRGFVLNAILGPLPVAPSPNNNRYFSPDGGLTGDGDLPSGSPRDPGDPAPTFTNPFAMRGIL